MKKWEYKYFELVSKFGRVPENLLWEKRCNILTWLNTLGGDGWELCGPCDSENVGGGFLIRGLFKREIPDLPAAASPQAMQAGPPTAQKCPSPCSIASEDQFGHQAKPEPPTHKPEMHDLVSMVEHHQIENS